MSSKKDEIKTALGAGRGSAEKYIDDLLDLKGPVEKSYEPRTVPRTEDRNLGSYVPRNLEPKEPRTDRHAARRERRGQLNVEVNRDKLKRLKAFCVERDITLVEAIDEAINLLLGLGTKEPRNLGRQEPRNLETYPHDHDDYRSDINHHHGEVKGAYRELTGNLWTRQDERDYRKVAELAVEEVVGLMKTIIARSKSKPSSFAYFAESIRRELSSPAPAGLEVKYDRFLVEIARTYPGLKKAEALEHLRRKCVRENVAWRDDVADGIMSKGRSRGTA